MALRLFNHSGSALPGRIIEYIDPNLLKRLTNKMKYGIILISGTNGKTSTAHMISNMLENQGLKVFSNKTGSNFSRGIVSEIVKQSSIFGNPRADVAVLELDEAYGVPFSKRVNPNITVLLNVFRDQLDRFGELEYTADLLLEIAKNTRDYVILNENDEYISAIEEKYYEHFNNTTSNKQSDSVKFACFGFNDSLKNEFLNDSELVNDNKSGKNENLSIKIEPTIKTDHSEFSNSNTPLKCSEKYNTNVEFNSFVSTSKNINENEIWTPNRFSNHLNKTSQNSVHLMNYAKGIASYKMNEFEFNVELSVSGLHNALNLAAAISAVRNLLGNDLNGDSLLMSIGKTNAAFGRGENIEYKNETYQIVLVKNPAGFRLALKSYEPDNTPTLIAINDNYADSRDVSWLYDVDHSVLSEKETWADFSILTGRRANDLQLKFEYANMKAKYTIPNIKEAINCFSLMNHATDVTTDNANDSGDSDRSSDSSGSVDLDNSVSSLQKPVKRIYATYTAMLEIRGILLGKRGLSLK